MERELLYKYHNGSALVSIYSDGTRIIEGDLNQLDYPLNLDIRVSTRCSFGSGLVCKFCHESATVDGIECDYEELEKKLVDLPKGMEIAIGSNELTSGLLNLLRTLKSRDLICNLTVNQGHVKRDLENIRLAIKEDLIKGLGISYRQHMKFNIPDDLLNYENMVLHTIAGINDIHKIMELPVKKVLVLGEKDFGFNKGNVDLNSPSHKQWYIYVRKLFDIFDVVSFDNLALEQLNIKRFMSDQIYKQFYQGEHSFYINAVTKTFHPSSRSAESINWDGVSIKEYYQNYVRS